MSIELLPESKLNLPCNFMDQDAERMIPFLTVAQGDLEGSFQGLFVTGVQQVSFFQGKVRFFICSAAYSPATNLPHSCVILTP